MVELTIEPADDEHRDYDGMYETACEVLGEETAERLVRNTLEQVFAEAVESVYDDRETIKAQQEQGRPQ